MSNIIAELQKTNAELEKEQVALKKFINFQGEVVEGSDAEITEKDKRIAEIEKENRGLKVHIKNGMAIQEAHERIATEDGEYEGSYVYGLVERFLTESPEFSLQAHNLEQQTKGLRDYSEHLTEDAKGIPIGLKNKVRGSNVYNWQTHFARELRYRSNNLSISVEALKNTK